MFHLTKPTLWQRFLNLLIPALQVQIILSAGFLLTAGVSLFYYFTKDPSYPSENLYLAPIGMGLAMGAYLLGTFLNKKWPIAKRLNLGQAAWAVVLSWLIACSISGYYFVLAGVPVPEHVEQFSFFREFIDGFYESMSGFTTTGTSVLPSVEAFPRSVIFWRALTHWIGGMGIVYMALTLVKNFTTIRGDLINSEAETPNMVEYKDEEEARQSGKDFLKIYFYLSVVLMILLVISGFYFRSSPYAHWYDNVFDAVTHMFSTIGTGGFGMYNASVGLNIEENGVLITGGLRNHVSEWILGVFMIIAATNLGLWYVAVFKKDWKKMFQNTELRVFLAFVLITTLLITWDLTRSNIHVSTLDDLRYAFFSVSTIVSTTGFSNTDFAMWPVGAQGILFMSYLVGGCVGSTAGGLKFHRFIVLYKYCVNELKGLIGGRKELSFEVDGVRHNEKTAGLIVSNAVIYYMIFFLGAILIMLSSSKAIFTDGSVRSLDFVSAFTASIANLGNIGPAIVNGIAGHGPTGNYSAYTDLAKILMATLMLIGRIGVLSFLLIFIMPDEKFQQSVAHVNFDSDSPLLLK